MVGRKHLIQQNNWTWKEQRDPRLAAYLNIILIISEEHMLWAKTAISILSLPFIDEKSVGADKATKVISHYRYYGKLEYSNLNMFRRLYSKPKTKTQE